MMMSPLNILSTSSALSNSSSGNSSGGGLDSLTNRSPDHCSKSPPSPALPPHTIGGGPIPTTTPNLQAAKESAAVANTAASLLHAFAGNPTMSSTLAQMFPGFPLHMAAAAAAAFYSGGGCGGGNTMAQTNPYANLYAHQQQQQQAQQQAQQHQLSSLLAAARMTPNLFSMQSGNKKMNDIPESKLSPSQASALGHSPNSLFYGGGQQNSTNRTNHHHNHSTHQHPLMPLTMMAKGVNNNNNGHHSPHHQSDSSRSSAPSNSSNSLLSPVLFSPMSASSTSAATINDQLNSSAVSFAKRKLIETEADVASTSAESPYSGNYHRMPSSRTVISPQMGVSLSGNNSSTTTTTAAAVATSNNNNNNNALNIVGGGGGGSVLNGNSISSSSSSSSSSLSSVMVTAVNANTGGVLQCPICSCSLDGIDINAHFFEEMHKIDSLRKLPDWSTFGSDDDSTTTTTTTANPNNDNGVKRQRQTTSTNEFGGAKDSSFIEQQQHHHHHPVLMGRFPPPLPPPPTLSTASGSSGNSYQKKLQLPQSRWETFLRIKQNRHTRLAAFMRLTRRKYEVAYENSMLSPSGSASSSSALNQIAAVANISHPLPPPLHHPHTTPHTFGMALAPPSHPPPPSSSSSSLPPHAMSLNQQQQHHHHHHHNSPTPASVTLAMTKSSQGAGQSSFGVFDSIAKTMALNETSGLKISPNNSHHHHHHHQQQQHRAHQLSPLENPPSKLLGNSEINGPLSRTPPTASPSSSGYPASLFAQNPAAAAASFLHSTLPHFYSSPYHSAAVAAAAAAHHLSPFSAYGFSGNAEFLNTANNNPNNTGNNPNNESNIGVSPLNGNNVHGHSKIWRSVDTEQLETDNENKSKLFHHDRKSSSFLVRNESGSIDVIGNVEQDMPRNRNNSGSSSNGGGGSGGGGGGNGGNSRPSSTHSIRSNLMQSNDDSKPGSTISDNEDNNNNGGMTTTSVGQQLHQTIQRSQSSLENVLNLKKSDSDHDSVISHQTKSSDDDPEDSNDEELIVENC